MSRIYCTVIAMFLAPHGPVTLTTDDFFFACKLNSTIALPRLTGCRAGVTVTCPDVDVAVTVPLFGIPVSVTINLPVPQASNVGLLVVIVQRGGVGVGCGVGRGVGVGNGLLPGVGLAIGVAVGVGEATAPGSLSPAPAHESPVHLYHGPRIPCT